ncbi:MAG: UpxY family transcription antiterminator [Candidatus Acidiferrum sp.]
MYTKSRQERVAAGVLENLGIRVFLPLITEVHRWSDRKKEVTVPLFASYLFVQIPSSRESQVRVLKVPGVINFVGNQLGPLAVPEKEIEDVRSVLSERIDCSPCPFLNIGERVRIIGGALDGIEGTLVGRGPDTKLVISIELIQRSMAISVYGFNVKPVGASRSAAA